MQDKSKFLQKLDKDDEPKPTVPPNTNEKDRSEVAETPFNTLGNTLT